MKVAVIIPAAGASSRYSAAGGMRSKLEEDLGGKPVLQRTVEVFNRLDDVTQIIVAGPFQEDAYAEFRVRHADRLGLLNAVLVRGGETYRWQTVKNALEKVEPECTHIAVHDAARPCIAPELVERLFAAAARCGAAVPVVDVPDTIKRVDPELQPIGEVDAVAVMLGLTSAEAPTARKITGTVDRTNLCLVQTPQVFEANLLRRAYEQTDLSSTDDAGLVERLGHPVMAITGDQRNIKITLPADIELARAILGVRPPESRATHKKF
jgi:2-C-methyl-D-erythritol 4-phosphate cytidylyltransferase